MICIGNTNWRKLLAKEYDTCVPEHFPFYEPNRRQVGLYSVRITAQSTNTDEGTYITIIRDLILLT